jgi:hypothetical protein
VLCIILIVLELDIGHRQQALSGAQVVNSHQPAEVGNSGALFGAFEGLCTYQTSDLLWSEVFLRSDQGGEITRWPIVLKRNSPSPR